jgi:hypothetical protein
MCREIERGIADVEERAKENPEVGGLPAVGCHCVLQEVRQKTVSIVRSSIEAQEGEQISSVRGLARQGSERMGSDKLIRTSLW